MLKLEKKAPVVFILFLVFKILANMSQASSLFTLNISIAKRHSFREVLLKPSACSFAIKSLLEKQAKAFDGSLNSVSKDLIISLQSIHFSKQRCTLKPFKIYIDTQIGSYQKKQDICLNRGFSNSLEIFDKMLTCL